MSNVSLHHINGSAILRAPSRLTPDEKRVFSEVVTSVRAGHFEPGDMALLVEFSRLTVLVSDLWEEYRTGDDPDAAFAALMTAQKSLFAACRMLRLTPSSRAPHLPSRESQRRSAARQHTSARGSYYDEMETLSDDANGQSGA